MLFHVFVGIRGTGDKVIDVHAVLANKEIHEAVCLKNVSLIVKREVGKVKPYDCSVFGGLNIDLVWIVLISV